MKFGLFSTTPASWPILAAGVRIPVPKAHMLIAYLYLASFSSSHCREHVHLQRAAGLCGASLRCGARARRGRRRGRQRAGPLPAAERDGPGGAGGLRRRRQERPDQGQDQRGARQRQVSGKSVCSSLLKSCAPTDELYSLSKVC